MDHDQKVCPRCGEPAAGYGFCPPCRTHIDSLTGGVTPAPDLSTAHVLREVVRLEHALADASKGMSDRVGSGPSIAAVEVDPAPARLPGSADEVSQRSDVARLEDVLTVLPRPEEQAIAPTKPAAPQPVPVEEEPAETTSVPPPEPAARAEVVSVPPPAPAPQAEVQPLVPSYVAAHVLRAAFLFEQTSAFESRPDDEVVPEPVEAVLPELDPARHAATSVPPPVSAPRVEPLPAAEAETSQRSWITAVCLLALIALVVVLTGRRPCRCDCHKSR